MVEILIEGPGKNALGTERMQEVLDAVRAADGAPLLLTGAGDAFAAGFLAGLSQGGMDLHHRIRLANAVGAMCVSSVGAADGIGTFAEPLDFMEQTHA